MRRLLGGYILEALYVGPDFMIDLAALTDAV
jgi:hypothetical protein